VPSDERDEERLDRELEELLQELRLAPTAYHRIRFRDYDKEWLVTSATRLALAGLVFLASALAASAFFVTGFVFDDAVAGVVGALAAVTLGGLWFGLPLARKLRR
jgi:hypothetical protein